jgi:hypothetical protein
VSDLFRIGNETYSESWPVNGGTTLKSGDVLERGYEAKQRSLKIVAIDNQRVYARPLTWWEGCFSRRLALISVIGSVSWREVWRSPYWTRTKPLLCTTQERGQRP